MIENILDNTLSPSVPGIDVTPIITGSADIGNTALSMAVVIDAVPADPAAAVDTPASSLEVEPEPLLWNQTEDGKWKLDSTIITDLPPECFNLNEAGELCLSANALDLLEEGSYGVSTSFASVDLVITMDNKNRRFIGNTGYVLEDNRAELLGEDAELASIATRSEPLGFRSDGDLAIRLSTSVDYLVTPERPVTQIMEKLGYIYGNKEVGRMLLPTPQTIESIAQEGGLPIRVVQETTNGGAIPVSDYLQAFADGYYPVGSGDLEVYAHDVQANDHIGGVVVLGSEGLELLSPLARYGIGAGTSSENRGEIGRMYDMLTSRISIAVDMPNRMDLRGAAKYGYRPDTQSSWTVFHDTVIKELERICSDPADVAEKNQIEFDDGELFDVIRKNLTKLAEEHSFGEEYDVFIDRLNGHEYEHQEPEEEYDEFDDDEFDDYDM